MRKKAYQLGQRYEVRQYWDRGAVIDREFWQNGQIVLALPPRLPMATITVDRCASHGTYIYADLPCRLCQERPIGVAGGAAKRSMSAASSLGATLS